MIRCQSRGNRGTQFLCAFVLGYEQLGEVVPCDSINLNVAFALQMSLHTGEKGSMFCRGRFGSSYCKNIERWPQTSSLPCRALEMMRQSSQLQEHLAFRYLIGEAMVSESIEHCCRS